MMVGNDFLPHCPHLEIDSGGLSLMLSIYIDLLPKWGGYLTNKDSIHPERFEEFVYNVAAYEEEHFARRAYEENEPGFALPPRSDEYHGTYYEDLQSWTNTPVIRPALDQMKNRRKTKHSPAVPHDEKHDEKVVNRFHKKHPDEDDHMSYRDFYYKEKLNVTTREESRAMVRDYLKGLHWVLHYYHKGCPDWEWYFPHLYSPLATDVVNLKDFYTNEGEDGYCAFHFEKGKNLSPLAQLLTVLPPQSAELLPKPLAELMLDPNSPLAEYYPRDFTVDQNGKRQSWEAVVKIPFIDAKVLLETLDSVLNDTDEERMLSNGEKRRNMEGEVKVYSPPNMGTWNINGDGLNGDDSMSVGTRKSKSKTRTRNFNGVAGPMKARTASTEPMHPRKTAKKVD